MTNNTPTKVERVDAVDAFKEQLKRVCDLSGIHMCPGCGLTPQGLEQLLTTVLTQNEARVREEEVRAFMEGIQNRANAIPPNLLLNEVVNYAHDRLQAITPKQPL